METDEQFRPTLIVDFVIKRGDECLYAWTEEISSRSEFFETADKTLRLFKKARPDVSLFEPDVRLEFERSSTDGGPRDPGI